LTRATILAEIYDPEGAVDAGYLDQLTDPATVVDQATAEARRLAEMPTEAIGATKRTAREAAARHILDTLADDMAGLTGPDPS
jgi:enoyl-CoA hydratase